MTKQVDLWGLPLVLFGLCVVGRCLGETLEAIAKLKKLHLDTDMPGDGAARAVTYHRPLPRCEARVCNVGVRWSVFGPENQQPKTENRLR